jgi:hypothetical protein
MQKTSKTTYLQVQSMYVQVPFFIKMWQLLQKQQRLVYVWFVLTIRRRYQLRY